MLCCLCLEVIDETDCVLLHGIAGNSDFKWEVDDLLLLEQVLMLETLKLKSLFFLLFVVDGDAVEVVHDVVPEEDFSMLIAE